MHDYSQLQRDWICKKVRRKEPDEQELSPASSVEARYLDTAEFSRRRKRMQSPTSSTGPYGGAPPPVSGRRPRLLLMGQRRSGKSSIASVVFHKMPPTETLFLESTTRIQKDPIHSFMDFQVWDFPGQLDYMDDTFDFDHIFGEIGALIWVIDAQDEILDPLSRLHNTIIALQRSYPQVNVEVFIHKVDGLSDEYKLDTQRDIMQRTQDELADAGYDNVQISYHLTSIYDHSIFEAFSKVIQKLLPQLGTLENLLNVLCSNSGIEKAFLFDVLSKIYIATDSSPVDVQSYEICSDFIDVIVDISEIYGHDRKGDPQENGQISPPVSLGRIVEEEQLPEVSSIIRLQNGMVLYLREINKFLALICLMRKESIERQGLVDYNVQIFQQALQRVFELGGGGGGGLR
ncbi:Gtr1/RagA G protein conserved region-domain-containing protein [Sphaerosporella brunnea]|uniref:GTP-binding protein n=1 Tax=Sphaerosporella brunnea TaxID=1250544 RepID=A0A5J5F525_9PEZI|nr:Gtr1/RagA G protein conserved region-domain-containing protein [Sphaerosporella brunnea]KAA8911625.1 Gtr1/RagA G protein conserved region-domain-containing protein [Sphaerosporella brunnea]